MYTYMGFTCILTWLEGSPGVPELHLCVPDSQAHARCPPSRQPCAEASDGSWNNHYEDTQVAS